MSDRTSQHPLRRILRSFGHAVEGIVYAARTQPNLRVHLLVAVAVLVATLFTHLRRSETIAVVVLVALVIAMELMNTAIESVVDLLTATHHPLAKSAKDAAAAAVFVVALAAVVVGALLFLPTLGFSVDIVVAVLSIVAILTIFGKALAPTGGSAFHGGSLSGHASLAFAAATLLALLVRHPIPIVLGYLVAALVAQSRVEGGIHTWPEVVRGALLGTAVTLLVGGALHGHLVL